jgi:hypothetical protein
MSDSEYNRRAHAQLQRELAELENPRAAPSKPKQRCGLQRASIRHLRMRGTILATYWMSRDAREPQSSACAQRYGSRPTTATQCSILHCYCNEQTNMLRRQITGVAISPAIVNRNGLRERVDH